MSSKKKLLNRQRAWAQSVSLDVDGRGYLNSVEANLFQPLSDKIRQSFVEGSGSELQDTLSRPAKMKALHSSSALAVNVFDYWVERVSTPLLKAMHIDSDAAHIAFEKQYPTGLTGNPPNLDVTLELPDGLVVGVESKFSEWLSPKSKSKEPFKDKYFPEKSALWGEKGLGNCQSLAGEMYKGDVFFKHLDVPQLLKHVLGMATQLGDRFSLYYIYYDWPGPESDIHRQEIERFDLLVGKEVRFKARTYQSVFSELEDMNVEKKYMSYLKSRYFSI